MAQDGKRRIGLCQLSVLGANEVKVTDLGKDLLIRLSPPAVTLVAVFFTDPQNFDLNRFLLSVLFGLTITIWASQFGIFNSTKALLRFQPTNIEVFASKKEKIEKVKSLYNVTDAVIYATHINDPEGAPTGKSDIAHHLYASASSKNTFVRIVSASTSSDKKWIMKMLAENRNPNYEILVIEDVPKSLVFQNLVLVEKGSEKKAFVSYRSDSADGSFAFSTINESFTRGVKGYLSKFSRNAIPAKQLVEKWEKQVGS